MQAARSQVYSLYEFLRISGGSVCNLHMFLRVFRSSEASQSPQRSNKSPTEAIDTCFYVFQGSQCAIYTCFCMFLDSQRLPSAPQSPNRSPTEAQKGPQSPREAPQRPSRVPQTLPRDPTGAQPRPTDAQQRPRRGPMA